MIRAITPNLALDRTLSFAESVSSGKLVRPKEVREVAGGKGANVARAVTRLRGEACILGFTAGWNGRKWRSLCDAEGLQYRTVELEGETRECHILVDVDGVITEVYEPGPAASGEDYRMLLSDWTGGVSLLTGSLPDGLEDFTTLFDLLPKGCVVDSSGPILEYALQHRTGLVTPNQQELAAIIGKPDADIADAQALFQAHGTPILLTMGSDGAAYVDEHVIVAKPPVVAVLNPVASGDCLLGAFLLARSRGTSLKEALRFGVAAGTENTRRGGGGNITAEGVASLMALVTVEEL